MHYFSDGTEDITTVQKQWTTYLHTAIRNRRTTYLSKLIKIIEAEVTAPDGDLQSFLSSSRWDGANSTPGPDVLFPMQEDLKNALNTLPERTRKIINSKIYEDKTFAVIAAELGMKESTVKTVFYNALHEMRWQLL